jgi:hypothetical protein
MMPRSVILFLAANPAKTTSRALDQECAAIERELKLTPGRDDFEFRSKWAVTVDELMRHLLDLQPAILHFSGCADAQGLHLQGDDGRPQPVRPAALTQMIKSTADTVRLVVLNACYSDAQAEALRDVVGCTIGMKGTITDDAARAFAIGLYRAFGHRRSVGNAYAQAEATLAGKGLTASAEPRCLARVGVDVDTLVLGDDAVQGMTVPAAQPSVRHVELPSTALPPEAAVIIRYDLFLAHPSVNKPSARALYDLLQPDVRVFLDERSLQPGDRWDREIPAAQRASRATVILISSHTDQAWYLGDEIVTAIALHRAAPEAHMLVPVLLEPGLPVRARAYGLNHVHSIDAVAEGGLTGVAARLRAIVARLRKQTAPLLIVPAVTVGGACDHVRLHDRLARLTDTIFEQILLHARVDRGLIAPATARLADRILDVAQLAAVDQDLCRRVATLLDQRAPWTR